jgi:Holliday junction resolvase RusA-like endonuclease
MIEITVHGEARPAGALQIGARGDGTRFLHHRSSSDLRKWMRAVKREAREAMRGRSATGRAVRVDVSFYVARPKAHFGTGRNAGLVKPLADAYPIKRSKGDIDKLTRACLDALTGVCFADDAQVVDVRARKRFADGLAGPLATVRVELMDDELDVAAEAA